MEETDIDWEGLAALREGFLHDARGKQYWESERLLRSYDATFAARIGWKWDAVLEELLARNCVFDATAKVIDWGCGTGIASRRFLVHFPAFRSAEFFLFDQAMAAQQFACQKITESFPGVKTKIVDAHTVSGVFTDATVLISHVLNELNETQIQELLARLETARQILWVESATGEVARRLVKVRESLKTGFYVTAPCTHQCACGLLSEKNLQHWCHHFARPPMEAFTEAHWTHFSRTLEIDLRSLPYSFLVMRNKAASAEPAVVWKNRIIGKPREYKGYMKVLSCQEGGVEEYLFQEREDKRLYKQLSKGKSGPLYNWKLKDGRIAGSEGEGIR